MGRLGLFDPDSFAITCSSVERCQFRFDPDVSPQGPVEGAPGHGALEAREPVAGIGASAPLPCARHEPSVLRDEPQELALRCLPATADAAPERLAHAGGAPSRPSSCSTGIPAGTSSGGAVTGCDTSRSTSPSSAAISVASGPWVAALSAGASDPRGSSLSAGERSGLVASASGALMLVR